ncbi:hypothetical protein Tco_0011465 [Tanacetum coccineum]
MGLGRRSGYEPPAVSSSPKVEVRGSSSGSLSLEEDGWSWSEGGMLVPFLGGDGCGKWEVVDQLVKWPFT